MSNFLSNLAGRSRGAFDTIAPRVPSRFEPTRRADGLLAGRTSSRDEGLEDISEMEGTAGVDALAGDPAGNRSRAGHRTGPMDASLGQLDPLASSSESMRGMRSIRPGGSIAPLANSPETRTPNDPAFHAKRIPGSPSAGSTMSSEAAANQPLDPASKSIFAPASTQNRDAKMRGVQGQGTQRIRPALSSRHADPGALDSDLGAHTSNLDAKASHLDALDSDLAVSASVGTPGQIDESPALRSHFTPRRGNESASASAEATDRARSGEARNASSATPASVEPARSGPLFQDQPQTESGSAVSASGRWSGDTARSLSLIPDRSLASAPRPLTADSTERAAARPTISNLPPATQPQAGAAAEPAIRVTIGRVEVRAVFPEQTAKRTPPPRFRPRVSLDDYLSRGGGAKR